MQYFINFFLCSSPYPELYLFMVCVAITKEDFMCALTVELNYLLQSNCIPIYISDTSIPE